MTNWIDLDKFHTITGRTYKICRPDKEEKCYLTLLKYYFSISSKKYKDEEEMTRLEERLYDLSYTVKVSQLGKYYYLTESINAIDPSYLNDESYTLDEIYQAFTDLKEPLIKDDSFDKRIFDTAKKELLHSLSMNLKNPEYLATEDAFLRIFKNTARDISTKEMIEFLKKIQVTDLYSYYLNYKDYEEITYMVGAFHKNTSMPIVRNVNPHSDFYFTERGIQKGSKILIPRRTDTMQLRVFYDLGIYSEDNLFYAATIFNYALGGSGYSELFRTVREKYGMCYSIDSDYMGASGMIMISAVIKKDDLDKVLGYIKEALDTFMNHLSLEKIKRLCILSKREGYDQAGSYLSDAFLHDVFPLVDDKDDYEMRISSVQEDDIKEVIRRLGSPYFIYGLGGDGK